MGNITSNGSTKQNSDKKKLYSRILKFAEAIYEKGVLYFIVSFAVPFIIMSYAFSQFNIHPFGDGSRQMLVVDLWHQYFPFFRVVHQKLTSHGSFLYSWQNGAGTNFLGLIAYYCASPLNLVSVFFGEDKLRDVLTVILISKIGFAGAFFSCFLRYTYKRNDFSVCIFSSMFALCSYMLGYYWNVMWFDTVALFPLVMTGVVAICRERKWVLYTVSLALSLVANYYIAYFTCIFCIFMFASAGITEPKGVKDFFVKLLVMIRSSVLGICLSAFLLLPAYYGLQLTHSADNTFPENVSWYEKWTDIFANLLSYGTPTKVEGLPNFYCGMLALILFGVFLFSAGIKVREKVSVLIMLAVIAVSCNMNKLNYIWHGFHFTNQIPYRFAFIFSFVLIASAFRAYDTMMRKGINVYQLFLMLTVPAVVFYLNYRKDSEAFVKVLDIKGKMSIIFIVCIVVTVLLSAIISLCERKNINAKFYLIPVFAIMWTTFYLVFTDTNDYTKLTSYFKNGENYPESNAVQCSFVIVTVLFLIFALSKMFGIKSPEMRSTVTGVMLAFAVGFELVGNTMLGVKTVDSSDYSAYPDKNYQIQNLLDYQRNYESQHDNSLFYRTEVTSTYTLNDSSLYGYYGISQFSSSANESVTTFMKRMGIYASEAGNRYCYRISDPLFNSLLGLKYIISKRSSLNSEEMALNFETEYDKTFLYRNKYPLSLGYMMNKKVLEMDDSPALNPFEYRNNIVKLACNTDENCYTAQPVALVEYKNMDVVKNGYGNYTFTKNDSSQPASSVYSYSGVDGCYLYGYATNGGCDNINVTCDGQTVDTNISVSDYPIVFPMGNGQEGSTSDVEIFAKSENHAGSYKLMVYALNQGVFERAYKSLADEQLNITKFSDSEIEGDITVLSEGIMFLSMPYEKGWKVYCDGKEAKTVKVFQSMLGAEIGAGIHHIKLVYSPEGFGTGCAVSASALLLCVLIYLFELKTKRRKSTSAISEKTDSTGGTGESEETSREENESENEKSESDDGLQGY